MARDVKNKKCSCMVGRPYNNLCCPVHGDGLDDGSVPNYNKMAQERADKINLDWENLEKRYFKYLESLANTDTKPLDSFRWLRQNTHLIPKKS